MSQDRIRIVVFKESKDSFLFMLDAKGIGYVPIPIRPGIIMNAGESVEIVNGLAATSPLAVALTWVIVEWIKARVARKIILQTKDNRIVHLEGFGIEDVQKLLEHTTSLTVIDPNKPLQQSTEK